MDQKKVIFNDAIFISVSLAMQLAECKDALGMESGAISDGQISASSVWFSLVASRGRLNSSTGWAAGTNNLNQWFQIDLIRQYKVTGVATQGILSYTEWVTQYKLQFSNDGVRFQYYQEQGQNITDKVSVTS